MHIIAQTFGGDDAAKATIMSRMSDGALEGTAEIMLQEADLGALDVDEFDRRRPFAHPRQREKTYINHAPSNDAALLGVSVDFMASADGWVIDPDQTSWSLGKFVARRLATFRPALNLSRNVTVARGGKTAPHNAISQSEAFIRRAVFGLRFRRSDIEAMIPFSSAGLAGANRHPKALKASDRTSQGDSFRKNKGGRPRDTRWEHWVAELVTMIFEDGFTPPVTNNQMYERVKARLASRGLLPPGDEAARRAISAVIVRLGER